MLIKLFGLNSEIVRNGANIGAVDMEGYGCECVVRNQYLCT